jgi:DUF4097 and DUF4098 domain-containing protein YvlB
MNRLILTLALAAALPVTQASVAAPDLSKVNGSLTAEAGKTYGDIDTVNGSITLEDKAVARNVETVNGSITLDSFARALDVSTVNGKILLRNGAAARSVETVNGSIVGVSNLRVEKTVETVNGNIKLLSMKVTGNVETVNGNITVGEDSVVTGHLKVSKPTGWGINWGKPKVPRIILGPNSQVLGGLIFEREVELYVHATAKYGKITYLEAEASKAEALKPVVFTGKQPDIK